MGRNQTSANLERLIAQKGHSLLFLDDHGSSLVLAVSKVTSIRKAIQ